MKCDCSVCNIVCALHWEYCSQHKKNTNSSGQNVLNFRLRPTLANSDFGQTDFGQKNLTDFGSHDSLRAQTCTFQGPCASNTTKIPREDTQRDTERAKWWREREEKERNSGRSGGGRSGGVQPHQHKKTEPHNNNNNTTTTTQQQEQQHTNKNNNTTTRTTTQQQEQQQQQHNNNNTTATQPPSTKCGQNTKTLKLAKVGLAKVGLAKVGHVLNLHALVSLLLILLLRVLHRRVSNKSFQFSRSDLASCIHHHVLSGNLVFFCTRYTLCAPVNLPFRNGRNPFSLHPWKCQAPPSRIHSPLAVRWNLPLCPGTSSPIQTVPDCSWHQDPNLQAKMSL